MGLNLDWSQLLSFLKYAGFGLTAISAIWGLVSRTTYEDENKRKRLTAEGRLAIALMVGSALISTSAFAVEGVMKFNQAQSERDIQARRDRQALRQELLARADAAERRADAAEQRERDYQLAQSVTEGTAANLTRLRTLIQQAERGLNPVTPITVDGRVVARVSSFNGPGIRALHTLVDDWNRDGRPSFTPGVTFFSRDIGEQLSVPAGVRVGPDWQDYPTDGDEILRLTRHSTVRIKIVPPTLSAADTGRLVDSYFRPLGFRDTSHIAFSVKSEDQFGFLAYEHLDQTITFDFTATVPDAAILRSGHITSSNDLDEFGIIIVITSEEGEGPEVGDALESARFEQLTLTFGGKVFDVDCTQFARRVSPQRQTYLFGRFRHPRQTSDDQDRP